MDLTQSCRAIRVSGLDPDRGIDNATSFYVVTATVELMSPIARHDLIVSTKGAPLGDMSRGYAVVDFPGNALMVPKGREDWFEWAKGTWEAVEPCLPAALDSIIGGN